MSISVTVILLKASLLSYIAIVEPQILLNLKPFVPGGGKELAELYFLLSENINAGKFMPKNNL